MEKKLFYNGLLSLFVESYSLTIVGCLINMSFLRFDSFGLGFHSVMCLAFTVLTLLWPLQLFYLLVRKFHHLRSKYYRGRYGTIYEQIYLKEDSKVLLQPMFFFLRRLLLAIAVVILDQVLILQILFMTL